MKSMTLFNGDLAFSAYTCGFETNKDQPLVICLHGFPDNALSFRHQLPVIAEAGYRVIAPTLRGYEPSSQPKNNDYSVISAAHDILVWMDQLGEQKVHLVGHDWGAIISYAAGAIAPERFLSLTTLAVPHSARFLDAVRKVPKQLLKSWYIFFFQLPGFADYMLQRNDWSLIKTLWNNWSPDFDLTESDWQALRQTFNLPGVRHAMLSYYRQNLSLGVLAGIKKNAASFLTSVPVATLAITGAQDGCVDTRLYEHAFSDQDFPKGFRIERLNDAGHFCHQEKPEIISTLLLDWFLENGI